MRREEVLLEARFDEKLKLYWLLQVAWILAITLMGIPLLPFWLLGLGQHLCGKRYESQKAQLTSKTLHVSSGYLFKVEKHIPLDKIQDLSLREGPILRKMGLAALTIETAGNSQQGMPDATLAGLADAVAFRDAVLDQRDKLAERRATAPAPAVEAPDAAKRDDMALLTEIRDALLRIEAQLAKDGPSRT